MQTETNIAEGDIAAVSTSLSTLWVKKKHLLVKKFIFVKRKASLQERMHRIPQVHHDCFSLKQPRLKIEKQKLAD